MTIDLMHGDCVEVMRRLVSMGVTVDAIVTDPPYHLSSIHERWSKATWATRAPTSSGPHQRAAAGFMGKTWDGGAVAFEARTWQLALMLLKPGGHILAFGGTRTWHRMACAIEDAGGELRDTICWLYGQGFPKSHNQKGDWDGWGSALKPAFEPIILAQRPFDRSIEENLARHGVGALNIDACRVHSDENLRGGKTPPMTMQGENPRPFHDRPLKYKVKRFNPGATVNRSGEWKSDVEFEGEMKPGRWPANVIHDGSPEVIEAFAAFGADKGAAAPVTRRGADKFRNTFGAFKGETEAGASFQGDSGTAARFFYCAKAAADDRAGSKHPTVKPIALLQYLCRLVTPPGGTVLDMFAGSGTLGEAARREGFNAVLIEREDEYVADIERRCEGMP